MSTEEIIQFLREDGTLVENYTPELTNEELKYLYTLMVNTRTYEEKSLKLQRTGRIGFYIGCKGQEASHIGSAYVLKDSDWFFPSYRNHGILLLKGMSLKSIICQMIGNEGDPCKGRQMPCHFSYNEPNFKFVSISSPLATQLPHAVGAAYAAKYLGKKDVTITYFGEGSTSEGDFHVSVNFAGVYKTPTVFICENNQWAISVPIERQTAAESIAIKAKAYGIPGVKVDGNDIMAVHHVAKKAVERARNGEGPTLIESFTYRLGSHSSSDDATRYRPQEVHEKWVNKDPIIRLELYLKNNNILSEEEIKAIYEKSENDLNEAIKEAEKLPSPKLDTLFYDVYEEVPYNLKLQMNALIDEQIRLGESVDNSMAFPL
ncbi:MAG: pyruvate dehydrogenase (acetyl-transferring) E1 component subunit alpha [Candidatus Sericytochromatia bacterium]